jgi:hypothetical protein
VTPSCTEEVEEMLETHELLRNGPYLRVALPEVLPPDWDSLESELDLEMGEGVVEKTTIVAPCCSPPGLTVDARCDSRVSSVGAVFASGSSVATTQRERAG